MSQRDAPRRGPPGGPWLDAALVATVALLVHARSLTAGWAGLDDRDLVVDDQGWLAGPDSLLGVFGRGYMHPVDAAHPYYRPLVTFTYALDAHLGGPAPAGYHATNVALHGLACALLLQVLRLFSPGRGPALAVTLAFAAHPALCSAVDWIPGRNDTLLAALAFGAWLALARGRTGLHLVLFAGCLLTKETAVALPLVWAAQEGLLGAPGGRLRRLAPPAAGWAALIGARLLAVSPGVRPTLAGLPGLAAGLGQLAFARGTVLADVADLSVAPGLAAAALLAAASTRRAVRRRVVALGAVTFAALLAPVLVVPQTLWLDARLYLPAAGLAIAAAELLRALDPEPRLFGAFAGVAVAGLAALSLGLGSAFRGELAFAREAVAGSPRSALAHVCLGRAYQRAGQDDRALAEYATALALGPAEVAHNNAAVILMKRGLWADAERELRAELAVNPRYPVAHRNLAAVLRHLDRPGEAQAEDELAVGAGR